MDTLLLAPPSLTPDGGVEIERRNLLPYNGDMTVNPTATIRVSAKARDLLAYLAKHQGVSLSEYVNNLAEDHFRTTIIASEREAARLDEASPEARAEYELWEGTLADGID